MKVLNIISAVAGAIFRLVTAIAVVYLIYQGAGICYDYGYRIFTEPAISAGEGRTVTVTITEKMSPMEIGELFESRGLVRDAKLFTMQYYLSEYRGASPPSRSCAGHCSPAAGRCGEYRPGPENPYSDKKCCPWAAPSSASGLPPKYSRLFPALQNPSRPAGWAEKIGKCRTIAKTVLM